MPVPQLVPPGGLDQHGLLVALTPALLAAATGSAVAMVGDGRGGRVLGACGLIAAVALQALFLLPDGAAAAYTAPLGHGLVRVGYFQTGAAAALAAWVGWYWWPRLDAASQRRGPAWAWCLRVALALMLPVVALPLLIIGCESDVLPVADEDPLRPGRNSARRRLVRIAVAAAATVLALALLATAPGVSIAWGLAAVTCFVAAFTGAGGWRVPLVIAGVVMALPAW